MNQSSIARVVGTSRTTVVRWMDRIVARARQFNELHLKGVDLRELQADEIRTFINSKKNEKWVFAALEVELETVVEHGRGTSQLSKHRRAL